MSTSPPGRGAPFVAFRRWRNPSKSPHRLLDIHQIGSWEKDNEYIISSYRPASGSLWVSVASLLHLHNQSVNVYSHLVGASGFAFYSFHVFWGRDLDQAHGRSEGRIALLLYCWSVAICFACSAAFHLLSNHSPSVSSLCNRLDYLGIIVLMWGAMVSTIHFGFVCSKELRILYETLISLSALCCGRTILGTDFASARLRKRRAIFYAAFGSLSMFFASHGVVMYGWRLQYVRMSLSWMCWTAVANICGAIIYAMRLPERRWPRRFDVWGSSHQIFHLFVLLAAWLHLQGLTQALAAVSDMGGLCQ